MVSLIVFLTEVAVLRFDEAITGDRVRVNTSGSIPLMFASVAQSVSGQATFLERERRLRRRPLADPAALELPALELP